MSRLEGLVERIVDVPESIPDPGDDGYFAIFTPEGDQENRQTVCVWDTPEGQFRVAIGMPNYFFGWQGHPPPGCTWLPSGWLANHFPLGSDIRQLKGWFDYAEFLCR